MFMFTTKDTPTVLHLCLSITFSTQLLIIVCVYVTHIHCMYFQVRVCARPDVFNDTSFALSVGVSVIGYYEEFFGVEYPLPKQG